MSYEGMIPPPVERGKPDRPNPHKPVSPGGGEKKPNQLDVPDAAVKKILLRGGYEINIVPGTYTETENGPHQVFLAQDSFVPGDNVYVCGPTEEIVAVWFEKPPEPQTPSTPV